MGALKHVILPLLALIHGFYVVVAIIIGQREKIPTLGNWPSAGQPLSDNEMYLLGVIGYFNIAFLINILVSIFVEGAHYRGMVTLMDLIFALGHTYEDIKYGHSPLGTGTMAVLALVGLVIHSQEPGLFTKDKNKKEK